MKIINYIAMILGVILFISSVQFKKKKDILLVQTFASICYAVSYLLNFAYSGFITEIIEQIKDITFYIYEDKNKKIPLFVLGIFILGLIIIGFITYDGNIYTIAPLCINMAYFISSYFKNPKHIRIVVLICGFIWMYYNYSVGTYLFIIGNAFEVISASISIWRYNEKDKQLRTS